MSHQRLRPSWPGRRAQLWTVLAQCRKTFLNDSTFDCSNIYFCQWHRWFSIANPPIPAVPNLYQKYASNRAQRAQTPGTVWGMAGPNYRSVISLAALGTRAESSVRDPLSHHHSLLVFVAPFISCGIMLEEQRFPFRAILSSLPGSIPLLLLQHKFFLCCLVLITFVYCTRNVLPKPTNKQGNKLNCFRNSTLLCQLEI